MFSLSMNWLTAPAVIAAIVAGFVSIIGIIITVRVTGHREGHNRRRELYAKASVACISFREFVFVIYRRNHKDPEGERTRISTEIKKAQEEMAYFIGWIRVESRYVSKHYGALVEANHKIAGIAMKQAWRTPAITTDDEMTIRPPLDLSGIQPYEQEYLNAVRDHLSLWPTWIRRLLRHAGSVIRRFVKFVGSL